MTERFSEMLIQTYSYDRFEVLQMAIDHLRRMRAEEKRDAIRNGDLRL